MLFCIIDIIRHQKKIQIPTELLNKNVNRQISITNELTKVDQEDEFENDDNIENDKSENELDSVSENLPCRTSKNFTREVSFR